MDIQLQPSGWDVEARQLIEREGYTFEQAIEAVTLRYLSAGDYRPLLNSALRGHTHSAKVTTYFAAMFDPKYRAGNSAEPLYGFGFKPIRKSGRPARIQTSHSVKHVLFVLGSGVQEMAHGRNPGNLFWRFLADALAGGPDKQTRRIRDVFFPVQAKVQRIGGGKGRRSDPELPMRDKALAWLVQQRIDQGEQYKAAVPGTVEALRKLQAVEWCELPNERTVRNAYDRHAKPKPEG
jgi:hypothetical protein